jgi:hypothetical protein
MHRLDLDTLRFDARTVQCSAAEMMVLDNTGERFWVKSKIRIILNRKSRVKNYCCALVVWCVYSGARGEFSTGLNTCGCF